MIMCPGGRRRARFLLLMASFRLLLVVAEMTNVAFDATPIQPFRSGYLIQNSMRKPSHSPALAGSTWRVEASARLEIWIESFAGATYCHRRSYGFGDNRGRHG